MKHQQTIQQTNRKVQWKGKMLATIMNKSLHDIYS